MNIFISGGSKNFKSMYAQVVARALALGVDQQREKYPSLHGLIPKDKILQKRLYYIATITN